MHTWPQSCAPGWSVLAGLHLHGVRRATSKPSQTQAGASTPLRCEQLGALFSCAWTWLDFL